MLCLIQLLLLSLPKLIQSIYIQPNFNQPSEPYEVKYLQHHGLQDPQIEKLEIPSGRVSHYLMNPKLQL